ncbi:hypothetical protein P5P86_01880 [Nocardioides sp. BP30]|uniref:hypothetical protein n=1 Tax=Nocardioides sp. BP30 TaxID=3036374 RepID=UPI002468A920|nr:hypothetical protein [Nocardioides sp. BP30]WGL52583.1 hypothetical protein P5P86_01880 [Nocardioides sp. BP30]
MTVSGSFHRHLSQIAADVRELNQLGAVVLSPADPRVVDAFGDFLFVASDRQRTVKRLQDRHLAAIERSALLWLVAPDGYVGPSAALEIGVAVATGVPVFARSPINDLTLRQYVTPCPSITAALGSGAAGLDTRPSSAPPLVLEPLEGGRRAHDLLELISSRLSRTNNQKQERDQVATAAARQLKDALRHL